MDKVKLIHNKDKFLIEINNTQLHNVCGYKLEENITEDKGIVAELTLKLHVIIDEEVTSIDIEN